MRAARGTARFVGWVIGGWRPFVMLFGLGAAALYLYLAVTDKRVDVTRFWSAYLAAYSLFLLTIWTLNARKRLVVEEFAQYGGASHGVPVRGLATLLAMELSRLHNLYVAVEEEGEIPTAAPITSSLEASIGADNVGQVLKGAVSAESTFSLGPFKVPAGAVLGLIGQIVQGPRLTGALFADQERVVLTAQLIGDESSHAWRAEGTNVSSSSRLGLVDDLITNLASQIFAEVALARTVRWQAILPFSRGLREYRECLPQPAKHRLRLRRAADHFVAAIADSDDFDLAYYNFGVVSLAMKESAAAEAAFLSAINRNPEAPQGHYAIAQQRFTRNQLDETVPAFCDRVIDLRPGQLSRAQAYDLEALSRWRIATERGDSSLLRQAARNAARGAMHSALALLGAEFRRTERKDGYDQVIRRHEVVAASCYSTLAYVHGALATPGGRTRSDRFERWLAIRAMKIAISVDSANPYRYKQLAILRQAQGRLDKAVNAILKAARIRGEESEFWADAAFLLAQWGDVKRARWAAEMVLKQTSMVPLEQLSEVQQAFVLMDSMDDAARVRDIRRLRRLTIKAWPKRIDRLTARAEHYRMINDGWREGFIRYFIALVQENQESWDDAIASFADAITILDRSAPGESTRLALRAQRAELLQWAGKSKEALEEIDLARRLDPLNTWAGEQFAQICMNLQEWEQGVRAWETVIAQEAGSADRYTSLAWCLLQLGLQQNDPARRRELHLGAERWLIDAVALADPEDRGRTHYMLGYAFNLRNANDLSIPHLMVAKALAFNELMTIDLLANSCLGANQYDQAAAHADALIAMVDALLATGHPRTDPVPVKGIDPGEPLYPDTLLASAYNAKAYAAAQKGIAFAESHDWVTKAKEHTARIENTTIQVRLRAAVWDTEGWVLVRQSNFIEAISLFEKALAIEGSADRYWHLAVALDRKAASTKELAIKIDNARRAVDCCKQAISLDLWNTFTTDASALKARLESQLAALDPGFPAPSPSPVPAAGHANI